MNSEEEFPLDTAALDLGLAYLASKGISRETAHQCGLQFSSVSYPLILERLGRIEPKWGTALAVIWFPCVNAMGELTGWRAEAVTGN
jgi:hypothetical protein